MDRCARDPGNAGLAAAGTNRAVRFAGLLAVAAALLVMRPAAASDYQTVVNNGPAKNRVNIVFVGDGYTSAEIDTTYVQHIEAVLAHFFSDGEDPFPRYENFFNVYRVNVVSNESGADVPPEGIYKDTALDGSYFYGGGPERLLYVDTTKASIEIANAMAGSGVTAKMTLVTVNDTRYGGGGGIMAVFAGGNTYAGELALHEMGHSFSGLADEYIDTSTGPTTYTGTEPYQANVTKDPSGAKWSQWLGYVDSLGTVGAYEGAMGYTHGVYRPTETSKMKQLGHKFNAVCREQIILDIYDIVNPLDNSKKPYEELVDPSNLWVDVIDPNVIEVEWYVDDVLIAPAAGEVFDLRDYGYGAGTYSVTARAYDDIDWVRLDRSSMEQTVTWEVELTPEPATAAMLVLGALSVLRRRRDG